MDATIAPQIEPVVARVRPGFDKLSHPELTIFLLCYIRWRGYVSDLGEVNIVWQPCTGLWGLSTLRSRSRCGATKRGRPLGRPLFLCGEGMVRQSDRSGDSGAPDPGQTA